MASGEGESVFFKGVAPKKPTTSSGWPHTKEHMGSTNRNPFIIFKKGKSSEVVGGWEVDLGGTVGVVRVNIIKYIV